MMLENTKVCKISHCYISIYYKNKHKHTQKKNDNNKTNKPNKNIRNSNNGFKLKKKGKKLPLICQKVKAKDIHYVPQ
jgi:hypothetical protein